MEGNGQAKALPTLEITWDNSKQLIGFAFDPQEFKTWDFVIALLDMAKGQAEQRRRETQLAVMQQAVQEQAIRGKLLRG